MFKPWVDGKMTLRNLAKAHGVLSLDLWWGLWSLHAPPGQSELKAIEPADIFRYHAGDLRLDDLVEKYAMEKSICRSRVDAAERKISAEEWFRAAERGELPWSALNSWLLSGVSAETFAGAVMAGRMPIEEFRRLLHGYTCDQCRGSGENWDVNIKQKTSAKIPCTMCNGWGATRLNGVAWPAIVDVQQRLERKQAKG